MEQSTPQPQRQHTQIGYINIICFFLMFLFGAAGSFFPMYSYWQNMIWNLANASFITGCVLSSVQLADKKWIIPAGGFILISIAFIAFFTLIPCDSEEKMREVAKNVLLILPAMAMISSYKPFPFWVKILGFLSCVPYILILILAEINLEIKGFVIFLGAGYFLIEVTAVCWGIYFIKAMKKEEKNQ